LSVQTVLSCGGAARYWDREADSELVCIAVHDETHDVRTFTFAAPDGAYFAVRPGQYFTFDVPTGGGVVQRCYSLSSSPLRPRAISVTVKRVVGGVASNWLHDNLNPGDPIRAFGPLGAFTPPPVMPDKVLLLSGGSGITPMMAIVRAMADAALTTDVVFLHGARSPKDFAFHRELVGLGKILRGFRLILLPENVTAGDGFAGLTGRISPALMAAAVPDLSDRLVMCCGPAPFMDAARAICRNSGVPDRCYMQESFDGVGETGLDDTLPVAAKSGFAVTFNRQGKTISVGSDQSILTAARAQGVVLPSSCANGLCGTCKSKLISGKVDMQHNGGIRQREIDAGFFLPCCSKPLGELTIDR